MDKTTKYRVKICETYVSCLDVDVPDGENPRDYIKRLCSNGEIDITLRFDTMTRDIDMIGNGI